jgi:hypothetical protein
MQLALAADPIGVVAAVDVAEIEGGVRDPETFVPMAVLKLRTPGHQGAHDLVHAVQGVVPERRVARVAAAPDQPNRLAHHALMQTHGPQTGRLSDHRIAPERLAGSDQCARAMHG